MSFTLPYEIAVDQSDLEKALSDLLNLSYDDVDDIMVNMGFYKGNGDVIISKDYPNDVDCIGEKAVICWLEQSGFESVRFYEDN